MLGSVRIASYRLNIISYNHAIKSITSNYMESPRYPELLRDDLDKNVQERKVYLKRTEILKNKYFGLRHGESQANIQGIISSDPLVGSTSHGLTSSGRVQARRAATSIIESVGRERISDVLFLSSNFTRARETATECITALQNIFSFELRDIDDNQVSELALSYVNSLSVIIKDELRERYFGNYDGKVLINYNRVWPIDMVN